MTNITITNTEETYAVFRIDCTLVAMRRITRNGNPESSSITISQSRGGRNHEVILSPTEWREFLSKASELDTLL